MVHFYYIFCKTFVKRYFGILMSLHRSIIKPLLSAPLALAELQPAAQVSLPTLRKAVQELIDARWIRVVGQAEANGGRPAMLFGLDDGLHTIIGVHIQLPGIRLMTADLNGGILHESEVLHGEVPSPADVVQMIVEYVAARRAQFSDRRLLGIGIATPGFIDQESGDIISVGRVSGWGRFPMCRRLEGLTGLPVIIANDIDCMAFAEFQHTRQPFDRNLAYIGFDEGVKASLFLNGALYKGSFGNAGLIASHLLHVKDIPDRQQVHDALTIMGVNQRFDRELAERPESSRAAYTAIDALKSRRKRFQAILQGAVDALPICRGIADTLVSVLAAAVANIIYIVQPDLVVMGGFFSTIPPELHAEVKAAIGAHLPHLIDNHCIIQQAKLTSPNSAAMGAAHHFLQEYITNPDYDLFALTSSGSGR